MKTVNVNSVVIGFRVVTFNPVKKSCTLDMSIEDAVNGYREQRLKNVILSSLLCERMESRPDIYKTMSWVSSTNTSPDSHSNPYQLIAFRDKETGERKFLLACVFERSGLAHHETLPDGSVVTTWINRSHAKTHYKRYRDAFTIRDKRSDKAATVTQ